MCSGEVNNVIAGAQSVGGQAEVLQGGNWAADEPVQGTQPVGTELQNLPEENRVT